MLALLLRHFDWELVKGRSFFSGTITAKPVNLSVRSNASTLSRKKLSLNLSNTAIFKNVQDSLIRVNWLTLKKICDELSTLSIKTLSAAQPVASFLRPGDRT
jgi:hypothetical protein